MLYSSKESKIVKKIEAQCTEFMMHTRAMPNALDFIRSVKITLREIKERFLDDWFILIVYYNTIVVYYSLL